MATTIIRPCPIFENCPPDSPIDNFSSEASDPLDYFSRFYAGNPPPLLKNWSSTICGKTFISLVSQLDADLQAQAAAILCVITQPGNPGFPIFFSRRQTCSITCPDGNVFTYSVPPGIFPGVNQASADALAKAVACNLVRQHQICLGPIQNECCSGAPFTATITATGPLVFGPGNNWQVTGGFLPVGLSLLSSGGNTAVLTGTPSGSGSFVFQVSVLTPNGDSMTKVFSLCVIDISPASNVLPNGQVGVAVNTNFSATSCATPNLNWAVTGGTLPPGLTLNATTGALTGTPTTQGTYMFTVSMTDGSP